MKRNYAVGVGLAILGNVALASTYTFDCTVIDRTVTPFTNRQYELPINERMIFALNNKLHKLAFRNHQNILLIEVQNSDGTTLVRSSIHTVGSLQLPEPDLSLECSARSVPAN